MWRPGHLALAARLPVPETGPNPGRERFVLGLPGNPCYLHCPVFVFAAASGWHEGHAYRSWIRRFWVRLLILA